MDEGDLTVRTVLTLGLVACLMMGCASLMDSKKYELLDAREKQFAKAIRWGAYDMAASFIRPREGEPELDDLADYESIRVTSYEEFGGSMNSEKTESIHVVVFHFYHRESGSVHKVRHTQLWWYDEESKGWYLDGGLPDFKAVMAE